MSAVLKISGLTKRFGSKTAVDNISFEVQPGQVFGLLGPNGSGKTTTLSMVLTLLEPTSGKIELFGSEKLVEQLSRTGVLLESASYYPELSAVKNLQISCKIKNTDTSRIDEVLQLVNLSTDKNRKVRGYSLGMKQRLAIAAALLKDTDLLIFDEPTNGLDPIGIAEIRDILKGIAAKGKTILIASHLLNEMEKICTHIAILKNGKILDAGEMKTLMSGYPTLEDYFLAKAK